MTNDNEDYRQAAFVRLEKRCQIDAAKIICKHLPKLRKKKARKIRDEIAAELFSAYTDGMNDVHLKAVSEAKNKPKPWTFEAMSKATEHLRPSQIYYGKTQNDH